MDGADWHKTMMPVLARLVSLGSNMDLTAMSRSRLSHSEQGVTKRLSWKEMFVFSFLEIYIEKAKYQVTE